MKSSSGLAKKHQRTELPSVDRGKLAQKSRSEKMIRDQLEQLSDQLTLLQELTRVINDAPSPKEALQEGVNLVCQFASWPVGHIYLRNPHSKSQLIPTSIWYPSTADSFAEFKVRTEKTRLSIGKGQGGQVIQTRNVEWFSDLSQNKAFLQRQPSAGPTIKSGISIPLFAKGEVVGILELFSTEVMQPGKALLEISESIGIIFGSIVERQQANETAAKVQVRNVLLQSAAVYTSTSFFLIDRQGTLQFAIGDSLVHQRSNEERNGQSIFTVFRDVPEFLDSFYHALNGEPISRIIEDAHSIYEAHFTPFRSEAEEILGVAGLMVDITELKRIRQALSQSTARFRMIFEQADLGIQLMDLQGQIVECNPALQEMIGYSFAELKMKRFSDITHLEDIEKSQQLFLSLVNGSREDAQQIIRLVHKDGSVIWSRQALSLFRDEEHQPQYIICLVDDISLQKQMELELAEVQQRLIDSREAERVHLAQELHDVPLQELYGISYQLSSLWSDFGDPASFPKITAVEEALQQVIHSLRNFCGELRPPTLAPFGLEKAIRSHSAILQEAHPEIQIHVDLMADRKNLPETVRLALFRIYQNAIANVLRHSEAKNVWVLFAFDENQISLKIQDDGKGFLVPRRWVELVRAGHFGLVGAAERTQSIGGQLTIESAPGKGTSLEVIVPRNPDQTGRALDRLSLIHLTSG